MYYKNGQGVHPLTLQIVLPRDSCDIAINTYILWRYVQTRQLTEEHLQYYQSFKIKRRHNLWQNYKKICVEDLSIWLKTFTFKLAVYLLDVLFHEVIPRSAQPYIFSIKSNEYQMRSIKWVSRIPGDLVVKGNLSSYSDSAILWQVSPIHKKGRYSFFVNSISICDQASGIWSCVIRHLICGNK